MRSFLVTLSAGAMFGAPVAADPLRDAAAQFYGPLPATVTELEGHVATPEKVELGKKLFFETRLSASGSHSCVSCHDLAKGGVDGLATALLPDGQSGLRNTSSVLNAVLNTDHYWDGREADLAAQTVGPELAGLAMINTPEAAVAALKAIPAYAEEFALAFPGEADPVTADNLARALESFEATLLTPAPFDAWLAGDDAALSDDQKAGLQIFMDKGCAYCHFGPPIGGQGYYPLGLVELPGIDIKAADEVAQAAAADPEPLSAGHSCRGARRVRDSRSASDGRHADGCAGQRAVGGARRAREVARGRRSGVGSATRTFPAARAPLLPSAHGASDPLGHRPRPARARW